MRRKVVSALPYETDDFHYLVRMTLAEAYDIIENDEDFGDDGILRDDFALQDLRGDEEDDVEEIADEPLEDDDDDDDN